MPCTASLKEKRSTLRCMQMQFIPFSYYVNTMNHAKCHLSANHHSPSKGLYTFIHRYISSAIAHNKKKEEQKKSHTLSYGFSGSTNLRSVARRMRFCGSLFLQLACTM